MRPIENVIISPGSRNAPLTLGFVNHPKINAFSVVDERCAAFFGLGMAQQLQEPVVLLCTSGSALLNYYPAIAEAYYSKIPLSPFRTSYGTCRRDRQYRRSSACRCKTGGMRSTLRCGVPHRASSVFQTRCHNYR